MELWDTGTQTEEHMHNDMTDLLYYSTGSNCFFYSGNRQASKRGLLLLLFSLRFIYKVTNTTHKIVNKVVNIKIFQIPLTVLNKSLPDRYNAFYEFNNICPQLTSTYEYKMYKINLLHITLSKKQNSI
jgi:hypothetical protein